MRDWKITCFLIVILITMVISTTVFSQDISKRYAILVGVESYPHLSSQDRLHYCIRDVDLLKEKLINRAFFLPENIQVLKCTPTQEGEMVATKSNIENAINSLRNVMDRNSVLFFYFSGHGTSVIDERSPEPDGNEEYFLPADAMPDMRNFIQDDDLIFWLSKIPEGKKVIIVDACYQGEGKGYKMRDKGITVPEINQKDDLVTSVDIMLAASAGNEPAFEDDKAQNSAFTSLFAEALDNLSRADVDNDRKLNFNEITGYIKDRISGQNPQLEIKSEDIILADHTFGFISIDGNPIGADVYIGNEKIGRTPVAEVRYDAGTHILRIEKSMFKPYVDNNFVISPGWNNPYSYKLNPMTGTIMGRVVDDKSNGVPGVTVSLRGALAGVYGDTETRTSGDGSYYMNVSIGDYTGLVFEKLPDYKTETLPRRVSVKTDEITQLEPVVLEREVAGLAITTNITGVTVYLNGEYKGVTPLSVIPDLPTGDYTVRFRSNNIIEKEETVHVVANRINRLDVNDLEYKYGTLEIESQPSGATVKIGDKLLGTTPLKERMVTGSYTLDIGGIPGYGGATRNVRIEWNETTRAPEVILRKNVARIMIDSNVDDFYVTVTDKQTGKTVYSGDIKESSTTPELKFGNYTVMGRVRGFGSISKEVTISEARSTSVEFEFTGNLEISGSPIGADVLINGESAGKLPLTLENHEIGVYDVTVEAGGYEGKSERVKIETDKTSSIQVQLTRKSRFNALKKSLILPGNGQWYSGRKTSSTLLILVEAGAAIAITKFQLDYTGRKEDYDRAVEDYNNAAVNIGYYRERMDKYYDDLTKIENYRNYAIYGALGVWLYNVIDAYVFMPRLKENPVMGYLKNFKFCAEKQAFILRYTVW